MPSVAISLLLGLAACDRHQKSSTSTAIDANEQTTTNDASGSATNGRNTGDDSMIGAAEMHNSMARSGNDDRNMDEDRNGRMQDGTMRGGMGRGMGAGMELPNAPATDPSNPAAAPAPAADAPMPMKDRM